MNQDDSLLSMRCATEFAEQSVICDLGSKAKKTTQSPHHNQFTYSGIQFDPDLASLKKPAGNAVPETP
ncbi:MAG: hypothetical protein AB7V33_01800 [Halothiobacillus sp.]|jgi:hypothetical protein|nr:hypothetical protein [Halothiobacillus sp.]MDY0147373.1 hypothetical protein [Halothiobacillus sp.]